MEKGWESAVACILVVRYGRIYFTFSNKIQRNKPEGISRKEIKNGNATVAEEENRFKKKSKGEEKKK